MKRNIVIIFALIVTLIAAGGWYLTRRPAPAEMASYVPESALAYIEINDWPQYVSDVTATEAWRKTAPAYGIDEKIGLLGQAGWMAGIRTDNEATILARSQFAIVLTGIEVRGEEVRPRLALIVETHSRPASVKKLADQRLPAFARRMFGETVSEYSEYAGVRIHSYRPRSDRPGAERRLHSAIIEGELILANHEEAMRACIDARLDRMPDMASHFYLQNSRPQVDRGGETFGFITGEGVNRLLRFGAFMLSNAAMRETGLIEILQDVLSDLAARSSAGIAWGTGVEDGRVVDRYALLIKPDLVESVKPRIRTITTESKALDMLPGNIDDLTLVRLERPNQAIDEIERAVSARIGVGQSFMLHQFLLGARQSLLGIDPKDAAYAAIGDEIASFRFTDQTEERLWMIEVRDRTMMNKIAGNYLRGENATLQAERIENHEVLNSSDPNRGSAAIVEQFIILGKRQQLARMLSSLTGDRKLTRDPRFIAAASAISPAFVTSPAFVIGFDSTAVESAEMLSAISKWVGGRQLSSPPQGIFEQLPFSVSSTTLRDEGLYIETRSAFGTLPFFLSIIHEVMGSDGSAE